MIRSSGAVPRLPVDATRLQAVIMDVDGTLYHQRSVQRAMLFRLLHASLRQPRQGLRNLRMLRAYRKAQETLRHKQSEWDDLAQAQLRLACRWTGAEPEAMASCVAYWMEQAPMDLVARALRIGLVEFLQVASNRALRLGIVSDYRPKSKLRWLGIADFFEVVVAAQDPEVQRFKPHPRGIEMALEYLGVEKRAALYIGDRPEVDAVAACNAGVACVIIGHKPRSEAQFGWTGFPGYDALRAAICD